MFHKVSNSSNTCGISTCIALIFLCIEIWNRWSCSRNTYFIRFHSKLITRSLQVSSNYHMMQIFPSFSVLSTTCQLPHYFISMNTASIHCTAQVKRGHYNVFTHISTEILWIPDNVKLVHYSVQLHLHSLCVISKQSCCFSVG